MKPRLQTLVVKGISAMPPRREVGWVSRNKDSLDFIRKAFVVSFLSFSLLCVIQAFTSDMHVCHGQVCGVCASDQERQDWGSCVSSAKDWMGHSVFQSKRIELPSTEWRGYDQELNTAGHQKKHLEVLNSCRWHSQSDPTNNSRFKPQNDGAWNAAERLKSVEENMVHGIESRRQIKEGQDKHITGARNISLPLIFSSRAVSVLWHISTDDNPTVKGKAGHINSSR